MKKAAVVAGISAVVLAAAVIAVIHGRRAEILPDKVNVLQAPAPAAGNKEPFIIQMKPAPKSVNVAVSDFVVIVFARPMEKESVERGIKVFSSNGAQVEGDVVVEGHTAEFRPKDLFAYNGVYKVVVSGAIRDRSGKTAGGSTAWTFATDTGVAPRIRVKNNGSIILSDITGYDFNTQDVSSKSAPAVFTMKNEGNSDLVIWSVNIISGQKDQFSLAADSFPLTLHPGDVSDFSIVFHPESKGKQTAYLKIKSNDPSFGFFNLMVTGNGG